MTFLHTCGCVSARSLISEVYFGRALVPTVPRTVSLCLHPTNCALSLNTLSDFNYCLRVLGSGVAHSVGSLRGSASVACVHVQLVWFNVQNVRYREWSIEGSAEFHRTLPPPPPIHHMSRTADLPRAPSELFWECKWLTKGPPPWEHLECGGTPIMSV